MGFLKVGSGMGRGYFFLLLHPLPSNTFASIWSRKTDQESLTMAEVISTILRSDP